MVCIQYAVGLVAGISEEPFLSVCAGSSPSWMPLEHQTWASFEERLNMLQSKGHAAVEPHNRTENRHREGREKLPDCRSEKIKATLV